MTSDHGIEVTIQGPAVYGSVLSNYSDVYDAWDEEDGEECPDCYGTGMDRDEIYECATCWGEGFVKPLVTALDTRR